MSSSSFLIKSWVKSRTLYVAPHCKKLIGVLRNFLFYFIYIIYFKIHFIFLSLLTSNHSFQLSTLTDHCSWVSRTAGSQSKHDCISKGP